MHGGNPTTASKLSNCYHRLPSQSDTIAIANPLSSTYLEQCWWVLLQAPMIAAYPTSPRLLTSLSVGVPFYPGSNLCIKLHRVENIENVLTQHVMQSRQCYVSVHLWWDVDGCNVDRTELPLLAPCPLLVRRHLFEFNIS